MLPRIARIASALLVAALVAAAVGCTREPALDAEFTWTPSSGTSPLAVHFDATGRRSPSSPIDGISATAAQAFGQHVSHTYRTDAPRTFHVVLVVADPTGRTATAGADIAVEPASAPAPLIRFTWPFHFDAEGDDTANLNDEYCTLVNSGPTPVDLTGWSVENERGVSYRFPDGVTLAPGAVLTVHSGAGPDSSAVLHWNADAPIWSNTSDIAILRDATGDIVDVYAYASC